MRASAVADCEFLLRHLGVERARDAEAIDVGGTEFVYLDTEVRRNPLYAVHPQLTLLDAGFNIDELSTRAHEVVDMLDEQGTAHLRERFQNVYSFDTLEHVSDPGRFCANLIALTRPGGYIYLATVFDWQYHPSPEDYFRFSPTGLRQMFLPAHNALADQVEVLWQGWGTDRRGVVLVARRREDATGSVSVDVESAEPIAIHSAASLDELPGRLDHLDLVERSKIQLRRLRALPHERRWPAVRRGVIRASSRYLVTPAKLRDGAWMVAWPDVLGTQLRLGEFEIDERRFVERFLRPGMTVLDIGAHQGAYTLAAASLVAPHGRVIAFEPSPRERKRLGINLRLNRFRNVEVEDCALSDSAGSAPFYVVQNEETGFSGLRPPDESMPVSQIGTRLETLDGVLARRGIETVDFIKMDVEGGELDVLSGARELLKRRPRPVILCEVSDDRTGSWGYDASQIYDALVAFDFRWYSLTKDGLAPFARPQRFHHNLVAVPDERTDEVARATGLAASTVSGRDSRA